MNVWKLASDLEWVESLIDREAEMQGGEFSQELQDWLKSLGDQFEDRAEEYAELVRKKTAEAQMFEQQAKAFMAESAKLDRFVAATKRAIVEVMERLEMKKAGSFSLCANGGKCPVVLTDDVPEFYLKYQPSTDNELIREVLESGEDLPFALLGERGKHVRIKGIVKNG